MEANHRYLTTRKSIYVESSRVRHRAELVTDGLNALRERLKTAAGERVPTLEGVDAEADRLPSREEATDMAGMRYREDREMDATLQKAFMSFDHPVDGGAPGRTPNSTPRRRST